MLHKKDLKCTDSSLYQRTQMLQIVCRSQDLLSEVLLPVLKSLQRFGYWFWDVCNLHGRNAYPSYPNSRQRLMPMVRGAMSLITTSSIGTWDSPDEFCKLCQLRAHGFAISIKVHLSPWTCRHPDKTLSDLFIDFWFCILSWPQLASSHFVATESQLLSDQFLGGQSSMTLWVFRGADLGAKSLRLWGLVREHVPLIQSSWATVPHSLNQTSPLAGPKHKSSGSVWF